MNRSEQALKNEMINIGRKLYDRSLVVAKSGNLSCRLDKDTVLITASGTSLGALTQKDIVKVSLSKKITGSGRRPSSELPLHSMIYENFDCSRVIHCHPPLTNAYFAVYPRLAELIFETRHTIGEVPVVKQNSVTVTDPKPVISALKKNPLVVLKNHGTVAMADGFTEAFYYIEALESAVEVAAAARLFKKDILDDLDTCLNTRLKKA
ncbi:MAG: class II aldolase/adducin family protein [Candidatus Omnitrophica bacterium]|jgi:L-fuculose-phosphate aldolase|nr:class II aldolase/adducin family protein [Candidatus Omnitrophota bacterium]